MLSPLIAPVLSAALALQTAPAMPAAPQPLAQEHRALLRCAVAFAMVSGAQANGDAEAMKWPELGTRGREFFVRAMAQLMDAALLQGIDEGIDAADVATAVVDAIRAEQFWILTHADMRHLPVERMERAQRQENPG